MIHMTFVGKEKRREKCKILQNDRLASQRGGNRFTSQKTENGAHHIFMKIDFNVFQEREKNGFFPLTLFFLLLLEL